MNNTDVEHATEYHEITKHSELKVQMSRHYLDWENKPRAFKVYTDLPSAPLPDDFASPAANALACLSSLEPAGSGGEFDLRRLAQILFFSAGITREMRFDSGTYYMRAASATGALYPIELYVVCKELDGYGLPAGVYHFSPGDFSLTELRSGDYRMNLAEMAGGNSEIATSPVTIAFTSLAWRNAWKYQARSYRHWFWDSGVIAANLLAVASSTGLRSSLVMGFVDSAVNELLLLAQRKEAAIVLAPIGFRVAKATGSDRKPAPVQALEKPRFLALSKSEVEYPEIWQLHEASSLSDFDAVKGWTGSVLSQEQTGLESPSLQSESLGLGETILRRGSSRKFSRAAIPRDKLLKILQTSTRGIPLDFLGKNATSIAIYLVANAVESLTPGNYFYDRQANSLKLLGTKNEAASRSESGYLCLGQPLFGDASAVLFLMTDLDLMLKTFGNRGYRACQLEAGVIAGKVYLASYAQGLGASGSTFYDDAVAESFSPYAKGKAAMMAIGVGTTPYKARPGKILAAKLAKSQLLSQP